MDVLRQMAATRKLYENTSTENTAGSSDFFLIHCEWNSRPWKRILLISNPMNPFSKWIHQMENPDLDLPKGTRNPFLDLKSVFEFTERNTPKSYILRIS